MEMKQMGIKEIARQIGDISDRKLFDREGCVSFTDNEIVLCVKGESRYHATGVTFDVDTPRLILMAATNIINRMVFNLNPTEASAIVTSTVRNVTVHRRKQRQFIHSN
jgi:hypothetical protein